jgi:signal peptidase II
MKIIRVGSRRTWAGVFFLIVIEQFIKLVININFLDKRFAIFPPLLYFEPMFNRRYSWINSMLQIGDGKWMHIIIVSIMTILIFLFYNYLSNKLGNIRIINAMFAFIFSGAVCSLIDKIFWNGSLDYILVNGLFTFDLKDVYINIFNGLLLILIFFKNETLNKINDVIKDVMHSFKSRKYE